MAWRITWIIGIDNTNAQLLLTNNWWTRFRIQLKRDNSKEHIIFWVMDAWISMLFLLDNPCRNVELAESQYRMENSSKHSCCDQMVQENSCHIGSWYWKNVVPRTSRTIAKVTNILKELSTLSTWGKKGDSRVQEPMDRIPTTTWHHGMLPRIMARITHWGYKTWLDH